MDRIAYLASQSCLTEEDAEMLLGLADDRSYPIENIIQISLLGLTTDDIIIAILGDVPAYLIEAAIRFSDRGLSALKELDGVQWNDE